MWINKVINCHVTLLSFMHFDIDRLFPPDQDAVGRIHPVGSGDAVQQRQGAGPAEPAGQIHEERRYQTLQVYTRTEKLSC